MEACYDTYATHAELDLGFLLGMTASCAPSFMRIPFALVCVGLLWTYVDKRPVIRRNYRGVSPAPAFASYSRGPAPSQRSSTCGYRTCCKSARRQ